MVSPLRLGLLLLELPESGLFVFSLLQTFFLVKPLSKLSFLDLLSATIFFVATLSRVLCLEGLLLVVATLLLGCCLLLLVELRLLNRRRSRRSRIREGHARV